MKRIIVVSEDGTGGEEFTLCDKCSSSFHESAHCTIMDTDATECETCDGVYMPPRVSAPRCCKCGQFYQYKWDRATTASMASRRMCFDCNFWQDILDEKEKYLIIGGSSFQLGPDRPSDCANFKGFGGREFRIRKFGSKKIIVTHDLWHQGKITAAFRKLLSDNAEFVDEDGRPTI